MEKITRKLIQVGVVLLTLFAMLDVSTHLLAKTIAKSDYQLDTAFRNNGSDVVNNGSYGDSRFIITPNFRINDSVNLENGDAILYSLPSQLQFDTALTREIRTSGDVHIANLTQDPLTKTAIVTIVNKEYFDSLGNNKQINVDITAVWDKTIMPLNSPRTFNLEGYGDITLTRIEIDEEPRGISKWGVQRSDNPNVIEWRIRINRDLNNFTNVSISDEIPVGQELINNVNGHYFHDFYNPTAEKPNVRFTTSNVTINYVDDRHFGITFEDMNAKGAFIYYQTRLIDPSTVDANAYIYNHVTLKKDGIDPVVPVTGRAKINQIGGGGSAESATRIDIVAKKELDGRSLKLQDGEFGFELVNSNNGIVTETTNDAN